MKYKVNYFDIHNSNYKHVFITETQLLKGMLLDEIAKAADMQPRYVRIVNIQAISEA